MDKKVILFNGPPGSGKDTAAFMARNFLDGAFRQGGLIPFRVSLQKFASPLKAAAHTLYGLPYSADYYEKEFGYDWKNKPQFEFFGKTPRDIYIALSEEFAKKHGGETFFGRIAARAIQLEKSANVFIYSDSGFAEEAGPVISAVGIDNVLLIELERNGHSFAGDSRGYIGAKLAASFGNKLKTVRLPNNQDQQLFRMLVRGTVADWLGVENA